MDDLDRQLVTLLEKGLPLEKRLFEAMASSLNTDEADILLRIGRLKQEGIIGRLSAWLDLKKLGYQATLMAMQFQESELGKKAVLINTHPGIYTSCRRTHVFNLWLTLILPAEESVQDHMTYLSDLTGAQRAILLPAVKRFKSPSIGKEKYVTEGDFVKTLGERARPSVSGSEGLDQDEKEIIRSLQEDLLLTDRPFKRLAMRVGMTEDRFFEKVQSLMQRGYIRKIAALFNSRSYDAQKYVLTVWSIPEEKLDWVGHQMVLFPEVRQCISRPPHPEFNYSLHTMIPLDCLHPEKGTIERMEQTVGSWKHDCLFMIQEYKKASFCCFPKELKEWRIGQEQHRPGWIKQANGDFSQLSS